MSAAADPSCRRHRPAAPAREAVRALVVLAAVVALGGCAAMQPPQSESKVQSYAYPAPADTTFDLRAGRTVSADAVAQRLRGMRIVFLGEQHTEPASHDFQLDMLRRLVAQGRRVTVALEMFPPSADPVLEQWRQGKLDEAAFVEQSDWYTHWGFPWSYYRELFLFVRVHGLEVHGVNAEPATREAVREGKLDDLPEDVRAMLADLDEPIAPHQAYVLDILGRVGHVNGLGPENPMFQRYYRVQGMWDRLMGERTARLAAEGADKDIVVLLVGSGHLAYGLGANLQAARVSSLPQFTVWDVQVPSDALDGEGRYAVPVGMADVARVYRRDEEPEGYPTLIGVRLAEGDGGVRVEAVRLPEHAPLSALQEGDVILSLNGEPVTTPTRLRLAYERLAYGSQVTLRVRRGDGEETLTYELKRSPHR